MSHNASRAFQNGLNSFRNMSPAEKYTNSGVQTQQKLLYSELNGHPCPRENYAYSVRNRGHPLMVYPALSNSLIDVSSFALGCLFFSIKSVPFKDSIPRVYVFSAYSELYLRLSVANQNYLLTYS